MNFDTMTYPEIKQWLRGARPQAQGRTWRRTLRDTLPVPVAASAIKLGTSSFVGQGCLGLAMAVATPWLLEAFAIPPSGTDVQSLDAVFATVSPLIMALRPLVALMSATLLSIGLLGWCVRGE